MASSRWCFIALVALAVFAFDVSAKPGRTTPAPVKGQEPQQFTAPAVDPLHGCEVEEEERVTCGTSNITAAQCESITCCFDGQQCYYGKAVTVQCTRDGQFVVVVARESTAPSLDLDSVSLRGSEDASCSPVGSNEAFIIFQFPVTACGTTVDEDESYVMYENRLVAKYEVGVRRQVYITRDFQMAIGFGPRGAITRDSHFELLFQCRYSSTAVEALVVGVNPVPGPASVTAQGPLRMELRIASGQCFTKGCVEEGEAYTSFYSAADYPVTKVLRQPVYVEVGILDKTDPDLVLTLERCWATTTPNPLSLPQWELLVDGCPYSDDRYLTTVVPVDAASGLQYPTHHKRFFLKMFAFVDRDTSVAMNKRVFIHCNAAVCYPTVNDSCVQRCNRQMEAEPDARRAAARRVKKSKTLSSGEVVILTQ